MKQQVIITISREYGCGAREVGDRLAKRLGIPYYDRDLVQKAAERSGLTPEFIEKTEQRNTGGVFYGTNAFCGVVLMGSCVVSLLFGKLAAGRLGRRGCCAVAFGTQAVAFLLIILYHFNYDHSFWDYLILYTVITLLAAGDSIWESQVGEWEGRDH